MNPATASTLADPKEDTYYTILLVFSILVWVALTLLCFAILYVVMIGFFLWLANGLLVARLRAEGVEVTPNQEPALHQALVEVCGRLGLTTIPRLYILQEGGLLNAFTTRHASRQFIVLYSDMLEACGSDSAEVRFVLGHEIGHIQRNHVMKHLFILPGRLLPLIGDAYSRACERTCDRYGAAGSADPDGAIRAMMMLSAGRQYGKTMQPEAFAAQHYSERGFFVSWHELTSAYPTLSQRVANLLALKAGTPPLPAKRHPLSYVFALFTLSGPGGGLSSLLLTVCFVGIFAAMLLPAMEGAVRKGQEASALAAQKAEDEEGPDTEHILKAGTIDPAFNGKWTATAGELQWTTIRHPDGRYECDFVHGQGADQDKWHQVGQWRILDGNYHEIASDGETVTNAIKKVEPDAILFGDASGGEETTYTETRVP